MHNDIVIDLIAILEGRLKSSDVQKLDDDTLNDLFKLLNDWQRQVMDEQEKRIMRGSRNAIDELQRVTRQRNKNGDDE